MNKAKLVLGMFLGLLMAAPLAASDTKGQPTPQTNPGFEKLKSLAGSWTGQQTKGEQHESGPIEVVYKVTSGGSAVEETLFPGTPKEMVTMYTADGSDVLMTHYCMIGNQPHMKAASKGNKLQFDFVDGTGMKSADDPHMGALVTTIKGKNHFEQEWTFFNAGQKKDSVVFDFERKK